MSNIRTLKVHGKGCVRKEFQTPTILISGKYLNSYGFGVDCPISITCEQDKITITKDS